MGDLNSGQDVDVKMRLSQQKRSQSFSKNSLTMDNNPKIFTPVKPMSQPTSCHNCGLHGSRRCSHCKQTYYCSVECQRKDWSVHSVICKPVTPEQQNRSKSPSDVGERNICPKVEYSPVGNTKTYPDVMNKITVSDLKESGLKEGMKIQGCVLEFSSPSKFFVQVHNAETVESLCKVTAKLKDIYTNTLNLKKGYKPATGEICVATYNQDKNWYRVLVQDIDVPKKNAQVLYLDFGNQETVAVDDLQQMHKDVELTPPAVMKCFVANVVVPPYGWTPECLVDVRKLLLGQQCSITILQVVQEELPCYAVDVVISASGVHMDKLLLEKGYSFAQGKSQLQMEKSEMGSLVEKVLGDGKEKREEPSSDSVARPQTASWKVVSVSVGDVFNSLVSEIQTPGEFFCQQVHSARQLAELLQSMSEHCNKTPASPNYKPAVGETCCAQFTEDNQWYRAILLEYVSDESALVGYVDFGNTEFLQVSRLRPILPMMLTLPMQAIKCSLAAVKSATETWSQESTSLMKGLVAKKMITVRVVGETEDSALVELLDGSVEPQLIISRCLIEAGVAVTGDMDHAKASSEEESRMSDVDSVPLKWAELRVGHDVEVAVCMLYSPGEFYCQIYNERDLETLIEVNKSLGEYCLQHSPRGCSPKKGEVYCAFFLGDGNWYRAMVMEVAQNGSVNVCFLDYGNTEEVSVDKLCLIPPRFLELPFQAIRCKLSGVKPVHEKWDKKTTERFQTCVTGIKLKAKAVGKSENCFSVELVESKTESPRVISEVLIAENAALRDDRKKDGPVMGTHHSPPHRTSKKVNISPNTAAKGRADQPARRELLKPDSSPTQEQVARVRSSPKGDSSETGVARQWRTIELPLNEAVHGHVLGVITPDLFYAFPKENRVDEAKLQQVMVEVSGYGSAEAGKPRFKPSIGDACCARFTGDGQWYRAIVLGTSESSVKVAYADYGNIESLPLSSLLPMKESFLQPPVQIIKCRLAGVVPVSKEWSPAASELLTTLLLGVDVTITVLSLNANIHSVSVGKHQETGVLHVDEKLVSDGLAKHSNSTSRDSACQERDNACCCRDLRMRVEKLEKILQHYLNQHTANDLQK
ncbi:tudor domain-containing protein 1 isoform X2 [Ascaphus truei]